MRAIEKEEKYHSARVVLRAGLRRERGLGWHAGNIVHHRMEDDNQRVGMGREPHAAGDPNRTTST
eukprot:2120205-Rhodomonas_salina.1